MRIGLLPLASVLNASKSKVSVSNFSSPNVSQSNVSFGVVCPAVAACMVKRRMAILVANPSLVKTSLDEALLNCASKLKDLQVSGCQGFKNFQASCCNELNKFRMNGYKMLKCLTIN